MINMSRGLAKVSEPLAARVQSAKPEDMLVVIFELDRPTFDSGLRRLDRQHRIQYMKEVFETELQPVEAAIENAGGEVLDRAWINHTVRARVPARSLFSLCAIDNIEALDLPQMIELD